MKGKELYSKDLLGNTFKKLGQSPSIRFLKIINFIDEAEMDNFLTKEEYNELRKRVSKQVYNLDHEELELILKVIDRIYKNLRKELWKAYYEKKARETVK